MLPILSISIIYKKTQLIVQIYYFAVKMLVKPVSRCKAKMKEIAYSHNKSLKIPVSVLHLKTVTTAIVPLQLPEENAIDGWEHLALQAQRINQMAAELESMILELKTIASTLDSQKYYQQGQQRPYSKVCDYLTVSVPWIQQKPNKTFVLTTRKIDLFCAEREAVLLAQKLRQQTRSKTSQPKRYRRVGYSVDADTNRLLPDTLVNKS